MRAPLSTAALRVATPGRMALPSVEQRRSLSLTALFVASSFGIAVTAGFGLGTWLLLHVTVDAPLPPGAWSGLVQVHGHAQVAGFAGLLVMGIGLRILPRFRGAADPPDRLALVAFALVAAGVVLRAAQVLPDGPARSGLLTLGGIAEIAGLLVYARTALGLLAGGENDHRPDELFLAVGAGFGVVGAMWSLVSLAPAIGGAALLDPVADRAAVTAMLLGFVASHIIGVALRVAPSFIAAPSSRPRAVAVAAATWLGGVTLTTFDVRLGPLALLAAGLVVAYEVGPFRRSAGRAPLPRPARTVRLAFRGAFAWLVVGLALLAAGTSPDAPAAVTTAARHALALGFLTPMVFGVGSRLIPALTGGDAMSPRVVRAALLVVNVAALLRTSLELVGTGIPGSAALLAASGPIALAALLLFASAAARTIRSAFIPSFR